MSQLDVLLDPSVATPLIVTAHEAHARDLVALLPQLGVGGGAVYDALVGYVAFAHDQALAT